MGGGYRDYIGSTPNYRFTYQTDPLPRFYSGATVGNASNTPNGWQIALSEVIIGQIGNNIYISASNPYYVPIGKTVESYWIAYPYEEVEDKNSILDYLPESWLLYAMNVEGSDYTKHVYCYNHNDLVADGIEQS